MQLFTSKKRLAKREPPSTLVVNYLRSIGNVVVNPFGMISCKPDTTRRSAMAHRVIHHIERPRITWLRMEQIVSVELRVVPAGISVSKRNALSVNRELTQYRW